MLDAPAEIKILVVEDSIIERELLVGMVRKLGYVALSVADGYAAISMVQGGLEPIGLVFLDLDIPEIDGISALGHLKTNYPNLPVVIVSGSTDFNDITLADQWGADGFIAKPAKREHIAEALARLTAPGAVIRHAGSKRA